MVTPETVRESSLPKAVAALAHSLEGQSHPWMVMMLQNLCQRVEEAEANRNAMGKDLVLIYRRLAKLERCDHAD